MPKCETYGERQRAREAGHPMIYVEGYHGSVEKEPSSLPKLTPTEIRGNYCIPRQMSLIGRYHDHGWEDSIASIAIAFQNEWEERRKKVYGTFKYYAIPERKEHIMKAKEKIAKAIISVYEEENYKLVVTGSSISTLVMDAVREAVTVPTYKESVEHNRELKEELDARWQIAVNHVYAITGNALCDPSYDCVEAFRLAELKKW